jgi:peptidoglycan/LPS O-acetylase OafA/YrhL
MKDGPVKAGSDPTAVVVRALITVLCVAALLAIIVIANGSELDETSARLVGTAAALAFFSLTGVAGSNLAQRRPEVGAFGYLTALLSLTALVVTTTAIWEWWESDWEPAGIAIVLAVASGHVSILLASARDQDQDTVRLARYGVLLAIAVLTLMAVIEISADGEDVSPQAFGIVTVLYLLGVLLLPLVRRMSADGPQRPASEAVGRPQVVGLDAVVIGMGDKARMDSLYLDVLGATRAAGPDGGDAYRIGYQQLKLGDEGEDRVRLVWGGSIESAIEYLGLHGVSRIEGPVDRVGALGPGRIISFHDPDGNLLELISYD